MSTTTTTASARRLLPLLIAGTLGRLPSVTLPISTLLLVADRATLTRGGLASGAVSLGAGGIGVLVGRQLDSERARPVLVTLALLHIPAIAALVALAGTSHTPLLVAVSLGAGVTVVPVAPVVRALLAQLAAPEERQQVFAWDAMSVEVTWIGGPLLVSAAVLVSGPALAVALSPVLAAVGVGAVVRQPMRRSVTAMSDARWLTRTVVQLIVSFALAGTAMRGVAISLTEIARRGGNDAWTGALVAIWALGSLLGGWLVARFAMPRLAHIGAALAITTALIGLGQSSLALTAAFAFLSGVPTAPFVASLNTLVSRAAAEAAHARAFAAVQAANTVMSAIGAALGGAAVDRFGPAILSIPGGVLLLAATWLGLVERSPKITAVGAGDATDTADAATVGSSVA